MTDRRPRILVLSTGGTIAGEAPSASSAGYVAGRVAIDTLLNAARGMDTNADLTGKTIAAIGSQDMDRHVWIKLHAEIEAAFTRDLADGIVITHGTDTAEETTFLLDLTLPRARPIVIASAMRPSNALGADGPRNLATAIHVAGDAKAHGRGVLLVMGDAVFDARGVYKASTTGTEAFRGFPYGAIGTASPSSLEFFHPVHPPGSGAAFRLPEGSDWPTVAILYGHADMDIAILDAILSTKPAGLVLAGVGHGNGPAPVLDRLAEAARQGVAVVRSSRVNAGLVEPNLEIDDTAAGFIAGGTLGPQKCRLLLQTLLANGITDPAARQTAFLRHV